MTPGAPQTATMLEALADQAKKLRATQAHWARMAADPCHRQKLEEALAHFDSYLPQMTAAHREVTTSRDLLAKVLRKVRPRILA